MLRPTSNVLLIGIGVAVVFYAITLLEFVAISPDLRIRAFLIDGSEATADGVVIRETLGLRWKEGEGQVPPRPGDVLQFVNRVPTPTFLDFFHAIDGLYRPDERSVDKVDVESAPTEPEWKPANISGLVQEFDEDGPRRRLVEVLYRSAATGRVRTSWVEIQSVPATEIALSFLWLIPHLGILLVGGAAFWQRPFDRSARLFYVTCVVTIGAYVGGFHWWTVANSAWLTFPFIVCGVLLPAVTLHFFLVYPRPIEWAVRRPRVLLVLLYAAPTVAAVSGAAFLIYAKGMEGAPADPASVRQKAAVLTAIRVLVNVYLVTAAMYYAVTLAALMRSTLTVREPAEKAQVRWILAAAILATIPVGYTIWLAATDRTTFAFGGARLPLFFASFGFLLAYAVGMVRHRLLLADEVVGKGVRYYAARAGMTVAVAAALTGLGLWAGARDAWLPQPQSTAAVAAVIVLAVSLLLAARDRIHQELDRRFFSEKYPLGAALRGVHAAAEQLTDENDLGRRVVESCRDVLDVSRAALYRRADAGSGTYRLAAVAGEKFPEELSLDSPVIQAIAEGGSIQRVLTGSRSDLVPVQVLLRRHSAQLLYVPPAGGDASTLLLLGPKANDAGFTAEDMTFLSALTHVAGVALDGVGAQRLHRRIAEQLDHAEETVAAQSRQVAGQARQIAVLQAELAELHRRQGTAPPESIDGEFRREIIRGESPAITGVLETVRKVAGSDATVMVRGESGTGKELLAQVIHDNSPRRDGPLVRVHCAALSPTLLESELFGHVKGAFTGADRDKVGRFQLADCGTLFLDEIGEISPEVQVKLLRVLQERCFEPVGSSTTIRVDVRLVTATNRNLEEMISVGEFREDLYYRLNVIAVTLPPLRERKEDVYDLAFTFLHRASERLGKPVTRIDETALAVLARHHWPGNIRELQNVIERAVVLADGDAVTVEDLPAELGPLRPAFAPPKAFSATASAVAGRRRRSLSLPKPAARRMAASAADRGEREQLIAALRDADGNKAEAARLLGLPRSTFFSKLKKHGLS